ncbi:hypothetical protein SAMD00019534_056920 [Acytostelium subglobosum LB1]|uniref:hypothetical protein n=1 Tax=Acytostelium subglobosum LB1 TaxID=1410327 RepID=UPI000644F09F|nr:hypothetical protein SAMD00019534_056920 [Acytostelium subglobosum LB1]GAM22517.1 hypothetical protein SAMD00019534_056920 [Acytostelium subglobosum LB1]|eukprot:XP_012754637.1 hypothetical protein SAMD00019534_056920 [Acytostelium subglobosum LB1]
MKDKSSPVISDDDPVVGPRQQQQQTLDDNTTNGIIHIDKEKIVNEDAEEDDDEEKNKEGRSSTYLPESYAALDFSSPLEFNPVFIVSSRWTHMLNGVSVREYMLYKSSKEYHSHNSAAVRTPSPEKMVVLSVDTQILDCQSIFNSNNILSAPVVECEGPKESSNNSNSNNSGSGSGSGSSNGDEKDQSKQMARESESKYGIRGMVDMLDLLELVISITQRQRQMSPSNFQHHPNMLINGRKSPQSLYQQSIKQALSM